MARRELSKESELTTGTKNDQKGKQGNDEKQSQILAFVTINWRKKDLVYLNLEAQPLCLCVVVSLSLPFSRIIN